MWFCAFARACYYRLIELVTAAAILIFLLHGCIPE